MAHLRSHRLTLRLSLLSLAHLARVSRFRLWSAEQGTVALTDEEDQRINGALRVTLDNELARLQKLYRAIDAPAESRKA